MPNLNLKGDAPESGAPAKPAASKPVKQSGGGSSAPLYIVIVLIVLGAAAYLLNSKGIVHLWGKKKTTPVMVETPPVAPVDTLASPAKSDTTGLINLKQSAMNLGTKVTPGHAGNMKSPKMSGPMASSLSDMGSSENGMYSIQVSSWESEQKANVEADVFRRVGFPAFVEKKHVAGEGTRFRVYIGRYDTDRAAQSSGEKMSQMLESGYWVVRLNK